MHKMLHSLERIESNLIYPCWATQRNYSSLKNSEMNVPLNTIHKISNPFHKSWPLSYYNQNKQQITHLSLYHISSRLVSISNSLCAEKKEKEESQKNYFQLFLHYKLEKTKKPTPRLESRPPKANHTLPNFQTNQPPTENLSYPKNKLETAFNPPLLSNSWISPSSTLIPIVNSFANPSFL